jgi:hypothetical protein
MQPAATPWIRVLPPGHIVSIVMMFLISGFCHHVKDLCLHREEWWFHTNVSGKPIGPIFKGLLGPSPLMVGPTGCLEMSVWNYHSVMHKIPKEWKPISNFHSKLQISFLQLLFSYYILKITYLKSLSCLVNTSSATELRKQIFF